MSNNVANKALSIVKSKKTIIIIGAIILIFLLIVLGKKIYNNINNTKNIGENTKNILPFLHSGKQFKKIRAGELPVSTQGTEYNFNFWLYIKNYKHRYNHDKCIMFKGLEFDQLGSNPGIWLTKNSNVLRVTLGLQSKSDTEIGLEPKSEEDGCNVTKVCNKNMSVCEVEDIPLQRWVNINIGLSNNVLDIYINGDLVKSCVLNGFPKVNKGDLNLCNDGGFDGFISNIVVSNRSLPYSRIQKLYKSGPE